MSGLLPGRGANLVRLPALSTPIMTHPADAYPRPRMYNRVFWLAYLANSLLMVCVSVLFRYADFVRFRGGNEFTLGLIVGIGMVGSLAMRGILGHAIDHYGARRVWAVSLLLVMASMLLHLTIASVASPLVYLARIVLMVGLAGAFGASLTFISLRAPAGRIGEMVGTLGSSGFIGLALGPVLGDWLFATDEITAFHIQRMFLLAAGAAGASLVCTLLATYGSRAMPAKRRPPMVWLLRRYHPGPILICAAAMGIGVMLPHTFLRPYAADLQIDRIRTFFLVYAATAFSVRIVTRHFTDRFGVRPVVQLGLGFMAVCMLSFNIVGQNQEWLLAVPAALGGIAHAFLFPAIVTGGSVSFPSRYRGLATTLVLAMFDLSNLVGQPILGATVEFAPAVGLPGYATMFVGVAGVMVVAAVAACWIRDRLPSDEQITPAEATAHDQADERRGELVSSSSDA